MYRVADGRLDEFVEAWRRHVRPLREHFGFRVEGAWTIPHEQRFVWIVGYDGPGSFEEQDRTYYSSAERAAIDPDPATLLDEIQTWFISPVQEEP